MNREKKATLVEELNGKFSKAKIAIVSDYRGLTVSELQELRRDLRKNDAEFRVAKNTLLRMAAEKTGFAALKDYFVGTSAITVSSGDPVPTAKILTEFSKSHPELKIRTAVLEGKFLTFEDIVSLSKLPGKKVLLGQLLSAMNAVPTGLVRVLSGVPRSFLQVLQAIRENKEQTEN